MSRGISKALYLYKDAYAGHPREVWTLAVITLINRTGTMVLPFLAVYLTTIVGFSLKEAGFLVSAFGIGSLAGSYLGGRLSDRIGPNNVIIISLFCSGLLFISLQFTVDFTTLFALIFTAALFGEAYRPAMTAAVGDYVPRTQTGRTMALLRLAINLGMSAAPAIGGFVAVAIGYSWLFWIDGITCITAATVFFIVSRKWQKHKTVQSEVNDVQVASRPPYRSRTYLLFLLSTFLMALTFMQWFHSVPVFIKTDWGFDERYIGILLGMSSLLVVIVEMPLINALEKAGRIRYSLLLGLGLIGLSFLILLLPKAAFLGFVAISIWTMGEILHLPFNTAVPINFSPPGRRGDYMAWYFMAWSLSNIIAPVAALAVAEEFGFATLWIALTVLTTIALFLLWRLSKSLV